MVEFEKAIILAVQLLVSLFSLGIGVFVFQKPLETFEIQRKFYERINWRIEPISIEKEIRNTKIMGIFLMMLALLTMVYHAISY